MRRYTEKGRVVYDRKKHRWSLRDLLRVSDYLGAYVFQLSTEAFEATAEGLLATVESEESYQVFSGGQFGGAGVTRSFDQDILAVLEPTGGSGSRGARIVIMVEKIGG